MEKEEILKKFKEFIENYDEENKTKIWQEHCTTFRYFWINRILNSTIKV